MKTLSHDCLGLSLFLLIAFNPVTSDVVANSPSFANVNHVNLSAVEPGTPVLPGLLSSNATPLSARVRVIILDFAFHPADLRITVGTTVTWINRDPDGHTVTEGTPGLGERPNERLFDSSGGIQGIYIQERQTFSVTFTQPGVYHYYCIPHPYMRGTITVVPSTIATSATTEVQQSTTIIVKEETTSQFNPAPTALMLGALGLAATLVLLIVLSWPTRKRD